MVKTVIAMVLAIAALGGCSEAPPPAAPEPAAPEPAAPEPEPAEQLDASVADDDIETAEAFIDAFYSFDPQRLAPLLATAEESRQSIMYYQGWAEGGNYKVLNRGACARDEAGLISCPITVQDDPVQALKTGFDVTDTFTLTFAGGKIVKIDTSSNDQPVYYQARKWVEENMPEVMAGPCKDRRNGGKTPGDCARAMTEGYRRFAASDEYLPAVR